MKMSDSIDKIVQAIIQFQHEVPAIKKNAQGYGYKYADYNSIMTVIRPILAKCGLAVTQNPHYNEEGTVIGIATHIEHVSGQYKHFDPVMIPINDKAKNIAQEVGTDVTYARRYSLACALNLVTDEDTDAFKPEPPKKTTQGGFTRDSSPRYEEKKPRSNNALGAWNELAEKERSEMRTGMPCRHESLDLPTERKKFFGIATKKGLTDPKMRALAYLHFGKESRSKLTATEFNQLSEILEREDDIGILKMIRKAKEMREAS